DLRFSDLTEPLARCAGFEFCRRCDIAVPDLELTAERLGDLRIQRHDTPLDVIDEGGIDAALLGYPPSPGFTQPRLKSDEGKAPAEREVDQRQRAVSDVHRADDKEVLGHMNRAADAVGIGIAELERLARCALARLQKRQQFAEDLRGIPTVDLLNDDDEAGVWATERRADRLHEDAVGKGQLAIAARTPSAHEILVGEVWVELDRTDARLVAFPHQCECEAFSHPSLARSRRSLQDQVLARAQALQQPVDLPALQKTALAQDVVNIVWHS